MTRRDICVVCNDSETVDDDDPQCALCGESLHIDCANTGISFKQLKEYAFNEYSENARDEINERYFEEYFDEPDKLTEQAVTEYLDNYCPPMCDNCDNQYTEFIKNKKRKTDKQELARLLNTLKPSLNNDQSATSILNECIEKLMEL